MPAPRPKPLVSIDDWAADAHQRIDAFVEQWKRDAEGQPKVYPLKLPGMGEWDEQYRCSEGA